MSTFEDMLQKITVRYHDEIKTACQPLVDHFGISCFAYNKIKDTGGYYCVGNNPTWLEYYFSEKLYLDQPHCRHPVNFQTGISLPKNIQCEKYQQISKNASEKFNINFSVILLNKVADGLELIGLDVNTPSKMHDVLLLNELSLIRKFVVKFIEENKFLFTLLEDNQVHLPTLMGEKFQTSSIPVMANLPLRKQFLKDIGIDMPHSLSLRENEVLQQLLNGNSAAQTGATLCLSSRTVEHYLERIKNKLNCFSKSELIQKARELERFGYFESEN